MNIEKIISYDMDQNCYLVYDDNKKGFLIDPGFDTFKILKRIEELGVSADYILLTHCHYDHIYSVNELRGHRKVVCGAKCSENLKNTAVNLTKSIGEPFIVETPEVIVSDGEVIQIGDIKIKCIATPGHTDGGFCYLADGCLFAGDTLFKRNVGRWDLPGGDENALKDSIKNKLFTLADDTKVFCGHGADTEIGYEKKFNFYVGA